MSSCALHSVSAAAAPGMYGMHAAARATATCSALTSTRCTRLPYTPTHQRIHQLQRAAADGDVGILHAVHNGAAVALHRRRIHRHNTCQGVQRHVAAGAGQMGWVRVAGEVTGVRVGCGGRQLLFIGRFRRRSICRYAAAPCSALLPRTLTPTGCCCPCCPGIGPGC